MSGSARLDNQDPTLFGQTPWQTVGPFFHYALPWRGGADLIGETPIGARTDLFPPDHYKMAEPSPKGAIDGERIEVWGQVRDGAGEPVSDAMIEIWQADSTGHYAPPPAPGANEHGFVGFGRASTSPDGYYRFLSIRPGAVIDGEKVLAPHIAVGVLGRGLLKRLVTRLYFEDAPENAGDPVLALVPDERRDTLIARRSDAAPAGSDPTGSPRQGQAWRLDIVLQGDGRTVFFDL